MPNPDPTPDLNDIIASAVQGRVEAQTLAALSDSEVFGSLVTAALQQQIEVPDGTSYGRKRISYMDHVVKTAIREQTKALIAEEIAGQADAIRAEVKKALRKSVGVLADSLVDGFVANTSGRFPSIKVEFSGE